MFLPQTQSCKNNRFAITFSLIKLNLLQKNGHWLKCLDKPLVVSGSHKILEEVYRILQTNISNMIYPNCQKEKLAQLKYCINLFIADLEQVLVQNL